MFRRACKARSRASARRRADGTARVPASAGGSGTRGADGRSPLRERGRAAAPRPRRRRTGPRQESEPPAVPRMARARTLSGEVGLRGLARSSRRTSASRSAASAPPTRRASRARPGGRPQRRGDGAWRPRSPRAGGLERDGARKVRESSRRRAQVAAGRDVPARLGRGVVVAPDARARSAASVGVGSQARGTFLILLMHWLMRFHTAGAVQPESAAASANETLRTQYERSSRRQTAAPGGGKRRARGPWRGGARSPSISVGDGVEPRNLERKVASALLDAVEATVEEHAHEVALDIPHARVLSSTAWKMSCTRSSASSVVQPKRRTPTATRRGRKCPSSRFQSQASGSGGRRRPSKTPPEPGRNVVLARAGCHASRPPSIQTTTGARLYFKDIGGG